jgi:hypothetical protein
MEIPTFREETARKKVAQFRSMMERVDLLTNTQRDRLLQDMQAFVDSCSMGNVVLGGAGIGLGAAILPVIGAVTGPIIGGAYGAYKARKLARYRKEVQGMIRRLAR